MLEQLLRDYKHRLSQFQKRRINENRDEHLEGKITELSYVISDIEQKLSELYAEDLYREMEARSRFPEFNEDGGGGNE